MGRQAPPWLCPSRAPASVPLTMRRRIIQPLCWPSRGARTDRSLPLPGTWPGHSRFAQICPRRTCWQAEYLHNIMIINDYNGPKAPPFWGNLMPRSLSATL